MAVSLVFGVSHLHRFSDFLSNFVASVAAGRALSRYIHGHGYGGAFWSYGLLGMFLGVLMDLALLVVSAMLLRGLAKTSKLSLQIASFFIFFLAADLLWSLFLQSNFTFFDGPLILGWPFQFPLNVNKLDSYSSLYASLAIASTTNLFFVLMCFLMCLALAALILSHALHYFLPNVLLRLKPESGKLVAISIRMLRFAGLAFLIGAFTGRPLYLFLGMVLPLLWKWLGLPKKLG